MNKKIIFILLISFVISLNVKSQTCEDYFPLKEGTELVTKNYDKKDKVTGWTKQIIKKKENTITGSLTTIYVENWEPKSDTATAKGELKYECKNGVLYVDMNAFINQQSMAAYQSMDVQVNSQNMTIPYSVNLNDVLDNGKVDIIIKNAGTQIFTMTTNITNRKVLAIESITTSAGTFDCVKITSDIESKMLFSVQVTIVEWYSKEVGVVKSENYDKNGKLTGYSVLETLTKPQ